MENRPRTRRQNEEALFKRYREWKKDRESGSGGIRSSDSSNFGVLETSSENNNAPLGFTGHRTNKIVEKGKERNIGSDDANYDNVETSRDIIVAGSGKKNVNSSLTGCTMKRIEKNKSEGKRNNSDLGKKSKSSGRISKKRKAEHTNVHNDDVPTNDLRDDGGEENQVADSVVELKGDKKYHTRSAKSNQIDNFWVSDEKHEDIAPGSSRKGVVNEGNENVAKICVISDDSDSDSDGQIIVIDHGSTMKSICSSSTKEVSNCNSPQYKGKDDLATPSRKRGGGCILEEWKSFGVSNQNVKRVPDKNRRKGVRKHVQVTDSSEELSESETISSSEPLSEEGAESSSSDEVVPSKDDKDCRNDNYFVISRDSSSVREDEKADEHVNLSRPKKIAVEPEVVKGRFQEREETGVKSTVADRLRSRRSSKATKIGKVEIDNEVMGSSSCPFTLSDDEMNVFLEEEDVGHKDEPVLRDVRENGKDVNEDTKEENKGKKKRGRPRKKVCEASISANKILVDTQSGKEDVGHKDKTAEVRANPEDAYKDNEEENKGNKRRGRPVKNVGRSPISAKKILVDSIWEKGDAQMEKLVSPKENLPHNTLALKFCFDDSDTDKSETSDIEVGALFEEGNYCMEVSSVGGSDFVSVNSMENIQSNTNTDPACGCLGGGDHRLRLDEQIGIICTTCHRVMDEISNILPEFHQGGRSAAREDFYQMDHSNFDAVQIEDFTSTRVPAFKHIVQAEGTVWDLVPGIRKDMYPHQQEGFEFIWKNIAGSIFVEKAKEYISEGVGSGCIISHAPGTGKTRLTIMFLQTYMKLNSDCRPLIIAPCSMLLTWEEEFRKWKVGIPFHNLNSTEYSGHESQIAVNLQKNDRRQGNDLDYTRLVKLFSWKTEKSVLGISYQLFEELANINVLIDKVKKEGKGKVKDNDTAGQIRKMLLFLPGLLVLDEGHIPRNRASQIWKALAEVQTERRIMLSGTPFQNNFEELLNTFCMVRPKFSHEIMSRTPANGKEKRRRIKSAAKGKWASMTNNIGKDDDQKLEELKKMISDFVHVYKGNILKEKLPGLLDFVVVLSPSNLQRELIELVGNSRKTFFKSENLRSLISVHPALFSFDDLSEKETTLIHRDELERIKLDPNEGVKTKFVVELIRLSWALRERVLIFSQFLKPLKLIMKQLRRKFHWTEGREILYIGGEHSDKERQSSIIKLNDPKSEARVLLASSRACSEGINLVGASRVVLLDVVWNPAITRQSTSRAYRLGQKKVVHVYHLIAGTWEREKYARQAGKDRISDLVFSSKEGTYKPENSFSVAEDKILQDMVDSMGSMFLKILSQPKGSDLIDTFC